QAFVAVRGRGNRADHLARRVLALLTRHRLVIRVGTVDIAGVVTIDAQPVHFASVHDLRLADHGHVVFSNTRHDAGIAAGAHVLVDRHAPGIAVVLVLLPEHRQSLAFGVVHLL